MIATVTLPPKEAIDQLFKREELERQALGALMQDGNDADRKAKWMQICQENLNIVTDFVQQYGWPSQSKCGIGAETAAFLMVQHGDANTALDKKAHAEATQKQAVLLGIMQQEATPGFTAFVTDRVLRNSGKPQRYGTQFYPRSIIENIEDPAHLDERRLAAGLGETHSQYLTRIQAGDKLPFRKLIESDSTVLAKFEHTGEKITPNHSLMLPFTDDVKPLKKDPFIGPYVAHFEKGNKQLDFIATQHEQGAESPTAKTIQDVFEKRKPGIVIFEGAPSDMDTTSPSFINRLKEHAAQNYPNGEAEYVNYLAYQHGIPFIGGEPNHKETCAAMMQKGYSELDMRAAEVLNWIPRWVRWEGVKGNAALDAKIREQQQTTMLNEVFPNAEPLTLETFKQWYDARDPNHKPLEEIINNDLGPSDAANATFINRYGATITAIRNTNLDKQIAKALNEHDHVLVVYGSGHYLQSRLVYEDMLGKPAYEQLHAPSQDQSQSLCPNSNNKAWQSLKAGDSVYLIAPSSQVTDEEIQQYSQIFKDWGLNVTVPKDINAGYYHWSNTPERIADHITEALHTPGVKAIVCMKGGEGASEVAHVLKERMAALKDAPNRGIPMFGYSDNTELHIALGQESVISSVQGPTFDYLVPPANATPKQIANFDQNRAYLRDYLMGEHTTEPPMPLLALNAAAEKAISISGELQINTQNSGVQDSTAANEILILEGRKADGLALKLNALEATGQLKRYKAVVLGRYNENGGYDGPLEKAQTQALKEVIEGSPSLKSIPVFFGMPFGHPDRGMPVRPIPINAAATITKEKGGYQLVASHFHGRNTKATAAISEQAILMPETQSITLEAAYFDAIQGTAPRGREMQVVGGKIAHNAALIPDASHLATQDMRGKNVLLHFDLDPRAIRDQQGAIHSIHLALMPLIAGGKLQQAASLTLSADVPFAEEMKSWLEDFAAKRLPNVQVNITQLEGKQFPARFAGEIEDIKTEKDLYAMPTQMHLSVMPWDRMAEGEYIRSDATVKKLADTLLVKARENGTSVLKEISGYLKELKHDVSNKKQLFRKRSASEIIASGIETGCTDRGLVFLALAKEAGIPAVYVETFKKDSLGTPSAGMEGHVFVNVYDKQHDQWHIYEPVTGYMDSYKLGGAEYVPVGFGKDHSTAYLFNDLGKISSTPKRLDNEDTLREAARAFAKQQGIASEPQTPSFLSWKTLASGSVMAAAALGIAAAITGTIGWAAIAAAAVAGIAGTIGAYALQNNSHEAQDSQINNVSLNHLSIDEPQPSPAIAMIRYRDDFAKTELQRRGQPDEHALGA